MYDIYINEVCKTIFLNIDNENFVLPIVNNNNPPVVFVYEYWWLYLSNDENLPNHQRTIKIEVSSIVYNRMIDLPNVECFLIMYKWSEDDANVIILLFFINNKVLLL